MQRSSDDSRKLSIGFLVVYVVTPSETCTAEKGSSQTSRCSYAYVLRHMIYLRTGQPRAPGGTLSLDIVVCSLRKEVE
jgi:hypothetical protein